jgi:integrase
MGTIRSYKKEDGTETHHAEVRLKGYPDQRASFRTKSLAKKWIQDTESSIRDGRHFRTAEAKKHTVGDLIDRVITQWLPKNPNGIAKKTALLTWWKKRLGHLVLADLTPAVIAEARDSLLSETTARKAMRSSSTTNRYLAAFSKALTLGVKEFGWLDSSPMSKVSKPSEGKGRDRLLTSEEKNRLLAACKASSNPYLYSIVNLALMTGMRLGEILGLHWEDVDFENKTITLHQTKNGDKRIIPLTGAIEKVILTSHSVGASRGLLFPPLYRNNKSQKTQIRPAFLKAMQQADIKGFTFHLLRHAAASYFAMQGATQGELQALCGWKSPSMTRRYVHYSQKHVANLMERMHANMLQEEPSGKEI